MREFAATFQPPAGLEELESIASEDGRLCVNECSNASVSRRFALDPSIPREEMCDRLSEPALAWLGPAGVEVDGRVLAIDFYWAGRAVCMYDAIGGGVNGEEGWCAYVVVYAPEAVRSRVDVKVLVRGGGQT